MTKEVLGVFCWEYGSQNFGTLGNKLLFSLLSYQLPCNSEILFHFASFCFLLAPLYWQNVFLSPELVWRTISYFGIHVAKCPRNSFSHPLNLCVRWTCLSGMNAGKRKTSTQTPMQKLTSFTHTQKKRTKQKQQKKKTFPHSFSLKGKMLSCSFKCMAHCFGRKLSTPAFALTCQAKKLSCVVKL